MLLLASARREVSTKRGTAGIAPPQQEPPTKVKETNISAYKRHSRPEFWLIYKSFTVLCSCAPTMEGYRFPFAYTLSKRGARALQHISISQISTTSGSDNKKTTRKSMLRTSCWRDHLISVILTKIVYWLSSVGKKKRLLSIADKSEFDQQLGYCPCQKLVVT